MAASAMAAPGEDTTPGPNPNLPTGCGIDIHVILDESTSIANAGATGAVRQAFRAFTSALKNTGSRMAVSEFSTVAGLPLGPTQGRDPQDIYNPVTDATIASIFEPYISTGFSPNGSTNWEDGLRMGRYFLPRPSPSTPHLTVFITDGDPNRVINAANVTDTEYQTKVPLDSNEVTSATNEAAKDRAVPNANAIKGQGSHILAVAVGAGLSSQASLDRIIAVSGPDVFSGTGAFDISTHDVYRVPNFNDLEAAMREAAFQLCAPSVNIRKQVDENPDPAVDDLQPGQGWSMTANVSPTPPTWVLPTPNTGPTATSATGADGFVHFQWTTAANVASNIAVNEVVQPGYSNDTARTNCTYRTPENPTDRPLPNFVRTPTGFTGTVPYRSIVTCDMINRRIATPSVDIQKSTNGVDADIAPGPFVPIGSTVTWTYLVTNTGNVPLSSIAVTDTPRGPIACPQTTLARAASMTCTATAPAVAGQYENTGAVTATGAGQTVTDSDPSHYFGVAAGIDIEKFTNDQDADLAPGPFIPVGMPVTWTYVVTNTGNSALTGVAVTDSQGVAVTCPATTLAAAASMTCTAPTAAAVAGQYENTGNVTGTTPTGGTVQDSDASHYFGAIGSVDIEKFTNGQDADTPPGPLVAVGRPVAWTYVVTNTGNVPIVSWSVTDDPAGPAPPGLVACPRIGLISPGSTVHCFGRLGVGAQAGQYMNTAAVNATTIADQAVTDSDPSHYFGVQGAISLQKFTNGEDANLPPGPFIPVGGTVNWTYLVTNTGNGPLTDISVVDNRGVTVNCPVTTLAADASTTCTAAGTADADQYTNIATVTGTTQVGTTARDEDPSNYFGAAPGIHVEKYTNGVEADTPADAPFIPVGSPVTWTYVVTNSGNTDLSDVAVTDDRGVAVTCPQTTLEVDAEMTCTATGTSAIGPYANTGTATGTPLEGGPVTDEDPSHYFGSVSRIRVQKLTNGVDANTPTGPRLQVGDPVTWTYRVTNPGNLAMKSVALVDSKGVVPRFVGGDANGNSQLDSGETWTYRATGTATAGQYANTATVTGVDVLENTVRDSDPSHYIAEAPPTPPVPPQLRPNLKAKKVAMAKRVRAGNTVRFRIGVRNTGRGTARRVRVCDPLPAGLVVVRAHGARVRGGRACFTARRLGPHRSRTFTLRVRAVITERARTVCNVATVSGRGVRVRRARACVRVLPSAATDECPPGGRVSAQQVRAHEAARRPPIAYAAC